MDEINFDFDDASYEWRKNKKYLGQGNFTYTCNFIHSNNKKCRRTIYCYLIKSPYIYGFGDFCADKYKNHPNRDIYCKRHINRKRTIFE